MRHLFFLLVLLGWAASLRAQPGPCTQHIVVRVVDSLTEQGLSGAWIQAPGNDTLVWTEEGIGRLEGICLAPSLDLQVFLAGYRPFRRNYLDLRAGDTLLVPLSPWGEQLEEITIHAHHPMAVFSSPWALEEEAIDARFGKSLAQISREIPGLRTTDHGMTLAKPVIHGLSGSRVQIVADDMGLEDQSWGAEHAPMVDPAQAGKIHLVEGAQALKYGSGAAGRVLRLEPHSLPRQAGTELRLRTMAMTNGRGGALSLDYAGASSRIPGLAWRGEARTQASGNYRIPGYFVANSAAAESSVSGRLGYSRHRGEAALYFTHLRGEWGLYAGSHTGSTADLLLAIESPYPRVQEGFQYAIDRPSQRVEQTRTGMHLHWDIPEGALDLRYGYQSNLREELHPQRGAGDQAQLHLELQTHQMNLDWEHDKGENLHGHWGLDLSHSRNRFRDGDRFLIPAYDGKKAAIYLIESLKLRSWEGEAGLRWELQRFEVYQPEGSGQRIRYYEDDYSAPAFSLGLSRNGSRNWQHRWQFHSSWRPPHVAERFSRGLHQGAARMEFGNPDLLPERSLSLSWDQRLRWQGGEARLRLYGQSFQGFIYPEPGEPVISIRGSFRSYTYEQVPAYLYGGEGSLDKTITRFWEMRLRASWVRGWDRDRQDWLLAIPSDQYRLIQQFRLPWPAGSMLEAEVRHVTEQRRLPQDVEERDYLRPPSAYTLVSARWSWAFSRGSADWEISLEAENLSNRRYREYLDAFRYYLDRPGRNLLLRVSYRFRSLSSSQKAVGED